ncbi:MAG: aldehyde dehydrogenase (NAD+) [Rhodothermales bacterium]
MLLLGIGPSGPLLNPFTRVRIVRAAGPGRDQKGGFVVISTLSTAPSSATAMPLLPQSVLDERLMAQMLGGAGRLRAEGAGQRIARLKRLRRAVSDHRRELQQAFAADLGKSEEAVDMADILPIALEISHAVRHLRSWMRPRRVGRPLAFLGTRNEVHVQPKGVGLVISAWNYPFSLTIGPLVSAVAAGCAVVVKPSEFAPNVARVVRSIVESCFAADEVRMVEGGEDVSRALTALPFAHVFFTGSTRVGRFVMKAAAQNLASVTLELGGKSPTVVDASADVSEAAKRIAFGKFSNAGQTCTAPDYVFVHESIQREFLAELQRHLKAFFPDGQKSREYGRLIHEGHHARLSSLCADALDRGANILGGETDRSDLFLGPTILTDVDPESALMQEEIFGPVLPIIPFSDLDEVIGRINARPPPLALYVFSRTGSDIDRLLAGTRTGGVVVNDTIIQFANPELPFGGLGESGMGRGHGHAGFMEFSNRRAVMHQRRGLATTRLFFPPFNGLKRRSLDLVLRMYGIR